MRLSAAKRPLMIWTMQPSKGEPFQSRSIQKVGNKQIAVVALPETSEWPDPGYRSLLAEETARIIDEEQHDLVFVFFHKVQPFIDRQLHFAAELGYLVPRSVKFVVVTGPMAPLQTRWRLFVWKCKRLFLRALRISNRANALDGASITSLTELIRRCSFQDQARQSQEGDPSESLARMP